MQRCAPTCPTGSTTATASTARWALGGIAGVALLLLVIFLVRGLPGLTPGGEPGVSAPAPATAISLRPSVAVLGFKNLSGRQDAAWLSTALSEMLTTELGAGGELRTVPGEEIARMKKDLSLTEGHTYSGETLARIRQGLGSDYVVLGVCNREGTRAVVHPRRTIVRRGGPAQPPAHTHGDSSRSAPDHRLPSVDH